MATGEGRQLGRTLGVWFRAAVLSCLTILALPALAGAATTRYASPTGSGSACSQVAPCNVQTAVQGAGVADGDEAILLPGTYTLSTSLLVTHAAFVHGEAGAARPLIESTALEGVYVFDAGATIERVEVRDSHPGGVALELGGGTADGVIAVHTASSGTACFLPPVRPLLLRDSACLATGEGGYGIHSSFNPGTEAKLARVRNVTTMALAPHSTGIALSATGPEAGSVTLDGSNLIADGSEADVLAFASSSSASAHVVLSHSNYATRVEEEHGTVTAPGSGTNQTAAPLLANPAGGDFRELPGSPTIDAGATDSLTGTLDLDGAARVQGAAPDIGASEFAPRPPPASPINTTIVKAKVKRKRHRARFFFKGSGGTGALSFKCKLDKHKFVNCRSPKVYKHLKKGKHVFRVKAVDTTGAVDPTPAKRKFRI